MILEIMVIFLTWLLGAAFTLAIFDHFKKDNTTFTGDSGFDVFLIIIWPFFPPCYLFYNLVRSFLEDMFP